MSEHMISRLFINRQESKTNHDDGQITLLYRGWSTAYQIIRISIDERRISSWFAGCIPTREYNEKISWAEDSQLRVCKSKKESDS